MKRMALLVLVGGLVSGAAQAALHDRGGGLVYDDVLDVTWLADANYAKTSGYDTDGLMTWEQAMEWAASLSYFDSVRGVTWDDWRLPTVTDTGPSGCDVNDCGFHVQSVSATEDGTVVVLSEMAHMYYVNLGFKGYYSRSGFNQSGWGIFEDGTLGGERDGLGPDAVINSVQSDGYWTGTPNLSDSSKAWGFEFSVGGQSTYTHGDPYGRNVTFYSWAVRNGDVAAVPEPSPAILFGAGFAGLALMRRRSHGVSKG